MLYININKIREIDNIRRQISIEKAKEIKESMQKLGLLQPVSIVFFNKIPYLEFGYTRLFCAKQLKWKQIQYVKSPAKTIREAIIRNTAENILRNDLVPIELGRRAYEFSIRENLSIKEISKEFGCSSNMIKQCLAVYKRVPSNYRNKVISGVPGRKTPKGFISLNLAHDIAMKENKFKLTEAQRNSLYEAALDGDITENSLNEVMAFLKRGSSYYNAIKQTNDWKSYIISGILLNKKQVEKMMNEYNCKSQRELFSKVVYGDIKEYFSKPKISQKHEG